MTLSKQQILKLMRGGDAAGFAAARLASADAFPSLEGETFSGMQLLGFDFTGLDLSNTEWEDCLLDGARFHETDLSGAYIHGSTFLHCVLEATNLEGTAMEGCVLRHTTIDGARLGGGEVSDCQLTDCTLQGLSFDEDEWSSITFNDGAIIAVDGAASLSSWTLRGARVEGFDTSAMNLERCNVHVTPDAASDPVVPEGFGLVTGRRRKLT